jgi:hypothetical protein
MFAGQTSSISRITNYAAAEKHFRNTNKPRSTKWKDYQRPLRGARFQHYRIETSISNPGEYYDLCLYSTVMARFHKPDDDGVLRTQFCGHHTNTSKGFMWDVLGVEAFNHVKADDGTTRVVPIAAVKMPGSDFSTDLYFQNDRLLLAKSSHTPIYKRISGQDDKAKRAHTKQLFEPLLSLAIMRMPEYEHDAELKGYVGGPFGDSNITWVHKNAVVAIYKEYMGLGTATTEAYTRFFDMGLRVFEKLASTRAYDLNLLHTWGNSSHTAPYEVLPADKRITAKEFQAALWKRIVEMVGLNKPNSTKPYPQFPQPDEITLSNVTCYPK